MNVYTARDTIHCSALSYIQLMLMMIIRQAILKSRKCECERDLEPTALFIGGYNKIWILNLELCNTVKTICDA